MSNQVSEYLETRLSMVQKELLSLVQGYQEFNDDVRMEKSKSVFYQIESYLQLKKVVILPLVQTDQSQNALFVSSIATKELEDGIGKLIENTTMLHVDEPDLEFYNNLCALQERVNTMREQDQKNILPWLETHLSMEQAASLMPRLKENAMQDALPSF
jgi:hypothetical protein